MSTASALASGTAAAEEAGSTTPTFALAFASTFTGAFSLSAAESVAVAEAVDVSVRSVAMDSRSEDADSKLALTLARGSGEKMGDKVGW